MRILVCRGPKTLRQFCRLLTVAQKNNHIRCITTHTFTHHASALSILPTKIDTSSTDFKDNASQFGEVMARMQDLHGRIHEGGPDKAREKHLARGKMLPREYVFVSVTSFTDGIIL